MKTNEASFLGTGWAFPPAFNLQTHSVEMVSDEEDIKQSLFILFDTMKGERIMNTEYGSSLQTMVYEVISNTLLHFIIYRIERAILFFEPRIIVSNIDIDTSHEIEGILYISVFYTIIQTNTRNNIVYPFYLREGTLLKK
jgi:phage baseplate assembly protein W